MAENKTFNKIWGTFKNLPLEKKKKKLIKIISSLKQTATTSKTLELLNNPYVSEEYIDKIYQTVMNDLSEKYEKQKENEKQTMDEFIAKLASLNEKQKAADEKDADEILSQIGF